MLCGTEALEYTSGGAGNGRGSGVFVDAYWRACWRWREMASLQKPTLAGKPESLWGTSGPHSLDYRQNLLL